MKIKNFTSIKSLLFDNKTIKQTIFKNTFWLTVAKGITILVVILDIFAARILGATKYGEFTFALAFVLMFAVFFDLGLSEITTRELAKDRKKQKEYPAILSLKIVFSVVALILIFFCSFLVTLDPAIRQVIWILSIYIVLKRFSEILFAFLHANQKMEYEAMANIFYFVLLFSIVFFTLFYFPSVENLSYSYLFASLIALIFILLFFHFRIQFLKLDWNKKIWKKFLGFAWPLSLTTIFGSIYVNIDSVMMGHWGQITETGWYNAAYKIVIATLLPMIVISQSFYPVLNKFYKESKEKLQNLWNRQVEIMIILAVPLMIGGIALAPKIMNFLYGESYNPSILAFQILIIMAGFWYFCYPYIRILVISEQQKKVFYITFLGAITNIILNLILIPCYSLYGAALATVITYGIVFFLMVEATKYYTSIYPFNLKLLKTLIITIFAGLIMYFIMMFILDLNILFVIISGIFVYFFSFFLLIKATRPIKFR